MHFHKVPVRSRILMSKDVCLLIGQLPESLKTWNPFVSSVLFLLIAQQFSVCYLAVLDKSLGLSR